MKLVVQVQLDRGPSLLQLDRLEVDLTSRLGACQRADSGDADGDAVNFTVDGPNLRRLWSEVRELLEKTPELLDAAIVVAPHPDTGWDRYYLLHHYDPDEVVDTI